MKILLIVVIAFAILFVWTIWMNSRKVNRYDYLDILNEDNWKKGRQVRQEMEEGRGQWISRSSVYQALSDLEEEGLVAHRKREHELSSLRDEITVHEYQLTPKGAVRREELKKTSIQK